MSLKASAAKVAASFLTVATGACTIIPPCDKGCMLETSARTMAASDDVGVRAAGVKTLRVIHPEFDKVSTEVRAQLLEAAASQKMVCNVSSVKIVDGQKEIEFSNCAKPPAPVPAQ
jgi:hypothetical protein